MSQAPYACSEDLFPCCKTGLAPTDEVVAGVETCCEALLAALLWQTQLPAFMSFSTKNFNKPSASQISS